MMTRLVAMLSRMGSLAVVGGTLAGASAHAQYGGYPGYGGAQGLSIQVGVGGYNRGYGGGYPASGPVNPGCAPRPICPPPICPPPIYPPRPGCAPGGYPTGYGVGSGYAPGYGRPGYPSPAQRQGFHEGQYYYETGIAPNRPLSPAEAQGFQAGERRAAATPWQLDPARQQGFREGQYYYETGIAPNRPLSPAEAQGFQAGERRAAAGYRIPY